MQLPPGRNAVQCKRAYKMKNHSDVSIDKFKARLVGKGFTQQHGVEFFESFSPVMKQKSIGILLAIAVPCKMKLKQFYIGTVYLNSNLKEIIFMHQPLGFQSPEFPDYVCLLLRSLYELHQSASYWNKTFDSFLQHFDLILSASDPCVYHNSGDPLRHLGR